MNRTPEPADEEGRPRHRSGHQPAARPAVRSSASDQAATRRPPRDRDAEARPPAAPSPRHGARGEATTTPSPRWTIRTSSRRNVIHSSRIASQATRPAWLTGPAGRARCAASRRRRPRALRGQRAIRAWRAAALRPRARRSTRGADPALRAGARRASRGPPRGRVVAGEQHRAPSAGQPEQAARAPGLEARSGSSRSSTSGSAMSAAAKPGALRERRPPRRPARSSVGPGGGPTPAHARSGAWPRRGAGRGGARRARSASRGVIHAWMPGSGPRYATLRPSPRRRDRSGRRSRSGHARPRQPGQDAQQQEALSCGSPRRAGACPPGPTGCSTVEERARARSEQVIADGRSTRSEGAPQGVGGRAGTARPIALAAAAD